MKRTHRRGQGEGTIVKRADGRYVSALSVPGAKRKWLYGKTRAEVNKKLMAALRNLHAGIAPTSDNVTVRQFVERWLAAVAPSVRPNSLRGYKTYLWGHVVPEVGHMRLNSLTPDVLERLYAAKLEQGLHPTSVRHIHAVFRTALQAAAAWGLLQRNVATLARPPRASRAEMQVFSPAQVKQCLSAARGERLEALYTTALFTGMRQGELFGLRWSDVDLGAGLLYVRQAMLFGQFVEPKTAKSRRRVAIGPTVIEALRQHRARQNEERLRLGEAWHDMDLVFANSFGRPLTSQHLLRGAWYPLLARAGLPRLRFHDLRHTAASLALSKGVPVTQVSAMLGHADVGTTLKVYAHAVPHMERAASDALEAAIGAG